MSFQLLAGLFLLTLSPSNPENVETDLSIGELQVGEQVNIETDKRFYRAVIVDPLTGETMTTVSTDGVNFSKPQKIFILGSTHGRPAGTKLMLVRMGQIRTGWRLELGLGSLHQRDRALTEPVRSVALGEKTPLSRPAGVAKGRPLSANGVHQGPTR